MQIIEKTTEFCLQKPSAVAIGKFDGIHLGHQKLIETILSERRNGLQAVIFTFDPSPAEFFGGGKMAELTTKAEKRMLFEQMGVDVLIEFPLTAETASMEPEAFVRNILVDQMKTAFIAAGKDLSFGAGGLGDSRMLQNMAGDCGFRVQLIEKVCIADTEISSSIVRDEVREGHMEKIRLLTGSPYSITGIVEHGKKLGRTIGMPTVNLMPPTEKLLPPNGVYYSEVELDGQIYRGITNIGRKPTVSTEDRIGVETFLYDFAQDVYGKQITVSLLSFKRPEQKFESVDELKAQMAKDISEGRYFHRGFV